MGDDAEMDNFERRVVTSYLRNGFSSNVVVFREKTGFQDTDAASKKKESKQRGLPPSLASVIGSLNTDAYDLLSLRMDVDPFSINFVKKKKPSAIRRAFCGCRGEEENPFVSLDIHPGLQIAMDKEYGILTLVPSEQSYPIQLVCDTPRIVFSTIQGFINISIIASEYAETQRSETMSSGKGSKSEQRELDALWSPEYDYAVREELSRSADSKMKSPFESSESRKDGSRKKGKGEDVGAVPWPEEESEEFDDGMESSRRPRRSDPDDHGKEEEDEKGYLLEENMGRKVRSVRFATDRTQIDGKCDSKEAEREEKQEEDIGSFGQTSPREDTDSKLSRLDESYDDIFSRDIDEHRQLEDDISSSHRGGPIAIESADAGGERSGAPPRQDRVPESGGEKVLSHGIVVADSHMSEKDAVDDASDGRSASPDLRKTIFVVGEDDGEEALEPIQLRVHADEELMDAITETSGTPSSSRTKPDGSLSSPHHKVEDEEVNDSKFVVDDHGEEICKEDEVNDLLNLTSDLLEQDHPNGEKEKTQLDGKHIGSDLVVEEIEEGDGMEVHEVSSSASYSQPPEQIHRGDGDFTKKKPQEDESGAVKSHEHVAASPKMSPRLISTHRAGHPIIDVLGDHGYGYGHGLGPGHVKERSSDVHHQRVHVGRRGDVRYNPPIPSPKNPPILDLGRKKYEEEAVLDILRNMSGTSGEVFTRITTLREQSDPTKGARPQPRGKGRGSMDPRVLTGVFPQDIGEEERATMVDWGAAVGDPHLFK
eukprot:TRINITY_DN33821_c0_g1_i1.p1 TRINITY_DN33821_c0_g1~~TRINITY_DN33821_c0_g1_i1.p1  ORF type:complete len:766 (+),score=254.68 TRINITY_DN33821_c0_g1_i1:94-2391(+)